MNLEIIELNNNYKNAKWAGILKLLDHQIKTDTADLKNVQLTAYFF
jgi:hypothetical protein